MRTSPSTHERGRAFEDLAAAYLERTGWRVVARNVRFARKEIDLIATRPGLVAFVEVKGRGGIGFGHPLDAITAHKRREIECVARWWVERRGLGGLACRFDAVAVQRGPGGSVSIEHVEDAWRMEDPGWGR